MKGFIIISLIVTCNYLNGQNIPCAFVDKGKMNSEKNILIGIVYELRNGESFHSTGEKNPIIHSFGIAINYGLTKKPKIKLESRIMFSEEKVSDYWHPFADPWSCYVYSYPLKINSKYLKFPFAAKFYFSSNKSG